MKPTFLLSSKAWMVFAIASVSAVILLSSCSKKNDPQPEPVGEAKVRYVNTVQGSSSQDFYTNATKLNTTAVAYGNASDYFTITSGANSFKFTNAGSTTANAESQAFNIPIGVNATVFYYQSTGGQLGVFAVGDDMTAPTAGKAKVRFFYINSFAGTSGTVSVSQVGQSTVLIPSLAYGDIGTTYNNVDPGAKFTLTVGGVVSPNVIDGGIVAGKNYTIWIDGTSNVNVTGHVIVQN